MKIKEDTKLEPQADETYRLEVTLTKTQKEKLEHTKELLSHIVPNGDIAKLLEYLTDKEIAQRTPKPPKSTATVAVNSNTTSVPSNTVPATAAPFQRYTPIPKKTRDEVLARDKCCQYRARPGFPQCGSRWQLEPDHIKPRWAGGTNEPENLQALCKNHNLHRYRQQANVQQL
jgi:hypothetical protein